MSRPTSPAADDFHVGYLPLPWAHSRFLRWFIPLGLWITTAMAGVGAWGMRPAGDGVWTALTSPPEVIELTGVAVAEPYAMVLVPNPDRPGEPPETVLVVEPGKIGSQDRFADHAGNVVTVRGHRLERDGRRMLEILELEPITSEVTAALAAVSAGFIADSRRPGEVTLAGELMDGKCHLGAMKPGDGMGHAACAVLCIRGGIPPLLRVEEEDGRVRFLLVVGEDGRCPDDVAVLAGSPIELTGRLGWYGDLPVLVVAG